MKILVSLIFAALLSVVSLQAQEIELPETKASLYAETQTLKAGSSSFFALHLKPKPGWHLYWKNYGDTGATTSLQWQGLPTQMSVGEPLYPAPYRLPFQDLMNYGYEAPITLLLPVSLPNTLPKGEMTLSAKVQWLACTSKICVPESAKLPLGIAAGSGAVNPANAALFAAARKALPKTPALPASFHIVGGQFQLAVPNVPNLQKTDRIEYFPETAPLILHSQPQIAVADGAALWLEVAADAKAGPETLSGVLAVITASGARTAYAVQAVQTAQPIIPSAKAALLAADTLATKRASTSGDSQTTPVSFLAAIGLALLGGLILNIMPCVFPVLALKALALTRPNTNERAARSEALAYTIGALLTFGVIGGALLGLRAGGASIGWGFQLQNPYIVGALALLMMLIGLNLLGLFEVGNRLTGVGADKAYQPGNKGSFWTGALAVIVATPCTAPFMASALGATLTLPPVASLAVFLALGVGMALPFLLLGFVPALRRALPKPGAWMVTARKLLSIPMFATALWLGSLLLPKIPAPAAQVFSPEKLEALVSARTPVFLYFTADWCLSCKVNERVALDTAETKAAFAKAGVQVLIGDWTKRDADIAKVLESYGRNGVPLYLYFKPGADIKKPDILPQVLTPNLLAEVIARK
jgi:DsbC/DsbD-like thiol-disulfide interchange protein/cytochrome c biogenesis protein CcdA